MKNLIRSKVLAIMLIILFCSTVFAADIMISRVTGAAAMSSTLSPTYSFELIDVRIHLDAASATSENFTITLDSAKGTAYDTLVYSRDMDTVTDIIWTPEETLKFAAGDSLIFAWANTNTRTYGLEIRYRRAA